MDKVRQERRKNRHLNERFFIILEDFVNEYKIAKSHPEVAEYSNTLANTQARYQKLEKDIFLQRNHLEKINLEMNKRIRKQNRNINEYKKKVDILKRNAKRLKPIENSSEGMFREEKEMYSMIHYEMIAFITGIVLASGLTYSTFRKS